jgi:hypothetical protein
MELDYFSKRKLIEPGIDGLTNYLVAELEGPTPLIPKPTPGRDSGKLPSTFNHFYIGLSTASRQSN